MFGKINNPLTSVNSTYGGLNSDNGPITFISNIIELIIVIGGLLALLNIALAGFQYISSQGDSGKAADSRNKIFNSFIGLAILALIYVIAAIISKVAFGTDDVIFNPKIFGPGTLE